MTYNFDNEPYQIDDDLELQLELNGNNTTCLKISVQDEVVFVTPWFQREWLNVKNRAETAEMLEAELEACGIITAGEYTDKLRQILNQIAITVISEPPIEERLTPEARNVLERTQEVHTIEGENREWLITLHPPDDYPDDKPHTFVFTTEALMKSIYGNEFIDEHISAFATQLELSDYSWELIRDSWIKMAKKGTQNDGKNTDERMDDNSRIRYVD